MFETLLFFLAPDQSSTSGPIGMREPPLSLLRLIYEERERETTWVHCTSNNIGSFRVSHFDGPTDRLTASFPLFHAALASRNVYDSPCSVRKLIWRLLQKPVRTVPSFSHVHWILFYKLNWLLPRAVPPPIESSTSCLTSGQWSNITLLFGSL